jgi:hypothetical protein
LRKRVIRTSDRKILEKKREKKNMGYSTGRKIGGEEEVGTKVRKVGEKGSVL